MTKNNFLTGVATLLLGFLFSCDNTTADPINNTLNGPNNPGSSGGSAPTITGPRILHKIVINNLTNQEFVTTGNVLEKAILKKQAVLLPSLLGQQHILQGKLQE